MWSFLAICVGLLALYGLLHERVIGTRSREILFGILRRTKQKINITVIMMQIATSISDTLSISFPIAFAEFLGLFNFVNINPFQVVAFECIGGYNYYDRKLALPGSLCKFSCISSIFTSRFFDRLPCLHRLFPRAAAAQPSQGSDVRLRRRPA